MEAGFKGNVGIIGPTSSKTLLRSLGNAWTNLNCHVSHPCPRQEFWGNVIILPLSLQIQNTFQPCFASRQKCGTTVPKSLSSTPDPASFASLPAYWVAPSAVSRCFISIGWRRLPLPVVPETSCEPGKRVPPRRCGPGGNGQLWHGRPVLAREPAGRWGLGCWTGKQPLGGGSEGCTPSCPSWSLQAPLQPRGLGMNGVDHLLCTLQGAIHLLLIYALQSQRTARHGFFPPK